MTDPADSDSDPASDPGATAAARAAPRVLIDVVHERRICYALQQNGVPFVRQIRLSAHADGGAVGPVRVTLATEPEICDPLELDLAGLEPGAVVTLPRVHVELRAGPLGAQTERERGEVVVSVSRADGEVLAERRTPLEILAYDEWPGAAALPEILAAFVLPNHPEIEDVLATASRRLGVTTGRAALDGYQSRDPRRALDQIAAIHDAVAALGLAYANPPASFEDDGQKIRTPERIRSAGLATCLDLVCFFAACIEQAGLHPLLVLVEGHAICGAWLEDESFPEPSIGEPLALTKRFELERLVLFETTGVTEQPAPSFTAAIERGRRHLDDADAFLFAIDVRAARRARIRPLPIRVAGETREVPDEAPVPRDAGDHGETAVAVGVADGVAADPRESMDQPPTGRIERWKRQLLDLTLRNRLIAHRDTKKTVPLLCPDLAGLEDALAEGRTFRVLPEPQPFGADDPRDEQLAASQQGADPREAFLREEIDERRLHAALPQPELERRLLEIYRAARLGLEESGANTLFLALGFLEWFETPESPIPRRAPLLLVPLELQRKTVRSGFRVKLLDDEARVNVTLLRKLESEFGITVTGVDPPPEDGSGLDVDRVLRRFREAVLDVPRWKVRDDAAIGLFSFTKFLMWRDLDSRGDDFVIANAVVRHLVENPGAPFDAGVALPEEGSSDALPGDALLCPMDADASQIRAVLAAAAGSSFVLQGPPGTGKSQTITNLIAHCLGQGLRVLFVAEKRAALDVVHRRLTRVGLGPFCLAVHSNRARKRDVLASIGNALAHAGLTEPDGWRDAAQRLAEARDRLNALAAALHRPRAAGLTAFGVLSALVGLREVAEIELADVAPAELPAGAHDTLREAAAGLLAEVGALGGVADHALLPVELVQWDPSLGARAVAVTTALAGAADTLDAAVSVVATRAGLPSEPASTERARFLDRWGVLLETSPAPEAALVGAPDFAAMRAELDSWITRGRARDALRTRLFGAHSESVLDLPHANLATQLRAAAATWWPLSWWRGRAARAAVAATLRGGPRPDDAALAARLDEAAKVRAETSALADRGGAGPRAFGPAWRGGEADWDALSAVLDWVATFRELLVAGSGADLDRRAALRSSWLRLARDGRDLFAAGAPIAAELDALRRSMATFTSSRDAAVETLALDAERAFGPSGSTASEAAAQECRDIGRAAACARRIGAASGDLRAWAAYHRARLVLRAQAADPVVRALESGRVDATSFVSSLERAFLGRWAHTELADDAELARFSAAGHGLAIERFRELDRAALVAAAAVVRARLAARLPRGGGAAAAGSASEMGVLQRELNKRARHKPIRRLFDETPDVLARLKPCMLMSPLSVAQYVGPGTPRFDLVVFDEASQIPVWDAIGAIARGDRVVVVGDSKQLPPTSFFDRTGGDDDLDDADAVEDLESILDECVAGGLPELPLRWHYRSRHESLITFSNHHYYDGRLVTFPNAAEASPRLGVSLRPVPDGEYDRARTRTNRVEAQALVADVVRRLQDPAESSRSIGVVTFSLPQQTLIEDLLDDARRRCPDLEPFFTDAVAESVFVKNLESVQGDERDVILFSVGYGPDARGRVSMNFGPLNRDGGERRLNVAVTRAREQVVVFSTLRPEAIDLVRTRAVGVAHLRAFLEYAERGSSVLPAVAAAAADAVRSSAIEDDVAAFVQALGVQTLGDASLGDGAQPLVVDRQVGCSEFRVDLALRDPARPERHALGIVLDGTNYAAARTARDRDRLREEVLSRLGWRLHHVWSLDWWYDRDRESARLAEAVRAALAAGPPVSPPPPVPTRFAAAPPTTDDAPAEPSQPIARYPVAAVEEIGSPDEFAGADTTPAIRAAIQSVLELEAPILATRLVRLIAQRWGVARVVRRVSERVIEASQGLAAHASEEPGGDGVLWRADQDPPNWAVFRVPSDDDPDPRGIEDIPLVEFANAAAHVLAAHVAMSREDLARETARLFGISRLGRRVRERSFAAIGILVARGGAAEAGPDSVRLPR